MNGISTSRLRIGEVVGPDHSPLDTGAGLRCIVAQAGRCHDVVSVRGEQQSQRTCQTALHERMRLACARVERPRRVHQYEVDVPAASAPPDRLAQPRRGGRYQPPWLTEDTPEAGGMAQAGNHRIAALHAADELWPTERKQVCVLHGEPGMGPFQRQARARPHYRHDVMSAFEQELHHAAPGSTAGTDDQNPHRLVAGAEWGAVGWQGIEGRRAGRGVRVAGMLRLASGRAQSAGDQAHPERDGRRSRRGLAVTVGTTRSACACQGARGGPRHGPADAAGPAAYGLTWASARCRSRAPRRWTA